jgi:uncharacterized protein (TIGR02594 family)
MDITAFELAQRFSGLKETSGAIHNPQVMAMLRLDQSWPSGDEVPWCSAFVNYIAWLLDLPRSRSLAARSWLKVGNPIALEDARPAFDIVILNRGGSTDPNVAGPGHVGFFAYWTPSPYPNRKTRDIGLLAGNQKDKVCLATFDEASVLGIRRLG